MNVRTKVQILKPGDVCVIPLDKRHHCYARLLKRPLFEFYDCRSKEFLSPELIVKKPILFKVWVMRTAAGRWKRIGNVPPSGEELIPPKFFKQDILNPKKLEIYQAGEERPATRTEVKGLERAAVWDPQHVEDRLRDHYAGKSNKWVESLKLKR